jgi:hypothetical protein
MFRRMFRFMVNWANDIDRDTYKTKSVKPVALSILDEFRSKSVDGLLEDLLTVPGQVQSTLGKPDLQPLEPPGTLCRRS